MGSLTCTRIFMRAANTNYMARQTLTGHARSPKLSSYPTFIGFLSSFFFSFFFFFGGGGGGETCNSIYGLPLDIMLPNVRNTGLKMWKAHKKRSQNQNNSTVSLFSSSSSPPPPPFFFFFFFFSFLSFYHP